MNTLLFDLKYLMLEVTSSRENHYEVFQARKYVISAVSMNGNGNGAFSDIFIYMHNV